MIHCRNIYHLLLSISASLAANGQAQSLSEPNPYEHASSDIPRQPERFRWILSNKIDGIEVNTEGAPVVIFSRGDPVVVSTLAVGTEIKLRSVRVYQGTNYWQVPYQNENGKTAIGWVSGMFVEKR